MGKFAQPMILSMQSTDTALRVVYAAVRPACTAVKRRKHFFHRLLRQLVAPPQTSSGLFASLAELRIATTLVAMNERPQDPWDLSALAALAGMSRTAFSLRFKQAMAVSPGKYLARLRMLVAQAAVNSGKGLKGAARASGCCNAFALSRALGRARIAA